jgi:hypothetical protein
MKWHRDIPKEVWVVGIVFFVGGLIVAPWAIFVILVTFGGMAAVGFLIDLIGRLYEKIRGKMPPKTKP